jgi:hypothetical protein
MHTQNGPSQWIVLISSLAFFLSCFLNSPASKAKDFNLDNPLNTPAPIFWCPGKTQDQQIATKQRAGCRPLYDQQADDRFRARAQKEGYDLPHRNPIKIVELQNAASKFSERYRHFLSCCLMSDETQREIVNLIDEANHILKAVQQKGIYNSAGFGIGSRADGSPGTAPGDGTGTGGLGGGPGQAPKLGTFARQYTLSEIVGTVARAREDLLGLKQRLEKLGEAQQGLNELDYEASGQARLQVLEEEESIKREFTSKKPPASAPTGMDIQDTTLRSRIGGDIEDTTLNANFGADIGASVSPYSNINESLRPRRGDKVHDSSLPHRAGTDLHDTVMPSSTGFEIDNSQNRDGASTIQRRGVGPSVGDSDLNSRRR